MKKRTKSIISLLVIVAMVATLISISAFAVNAGKDLNGDGKRTLTILGDSLTTGYGLSENPRSLSNMTSLHGNTSIPEGNYTQYLEESGNWDKININCGEAFIAKNYLRWLNEDYEAELAKPENYYDRFVTELMATLPKLLNNESFTDIKGTVKEDVLEADDIILEVGSNDIFAATSMDIIFRTAYYMFGMNVQPALTYIKGQFQTIDSLEDIINMYGSYRDFITALNQNMESYKVAMERLIGTILDLNPTANIYVCCLCSPMDDLKPQDNDIVKMVKDLSDNLIEQQRSFVEEESAYKDKIHFVNVDPCETWFAVIDGQLFDPIYTTTLMQFVTLCHPTYEGHKQYADILLKTMGLSEGSVTPEDEGHDAVCLLKQFTDLNTAAWYHEPVEYVLGKGIMTGVTNTQFDPSGTLTRAMVVTMLYAMDGKPAVTNVTTPSDIPEGAWYKDPVDWAVSTGVTAGYEDGTFLPNNAVTREELATMLRSYAAYKNKDITASGDLSTFADQATVSGWATDNVSWAVGHGIISGRTGNLIAPRGTATRAEAATMFARLDQNVLK